MTAHKRHTRSDTTPERIYVSEETINFGIFFIYMFLSSSRLVEVCFVFVVQGKHCAIEVHGTNEES